MVSVAQLAELQIVALEVGGSNPLAHPTNTLIKIKNYFTCKH